MRPWAQPFFAVKKKPQESRLQKECKRTFHRQRLADYSSRKARKMRPVGAELKFHWDASDDTQHEIDAEDTRPKSSGVVIDLLAGSQRKRLQHHNQWGQSHG